MRKQPQFMPHRTASLLSFTVFGRALKYTKTRFPMPKRYYQPIWNTFSIFININVETDRALKKMLLELL